MWKVIGNTLKLFDFIKQQFLRKDSQLVHTLKPAHSRGGQRGSGRKQRLDEESSPYWLGQWLDNKEDKSGANTVDRKNEGEIYKRVEAEGKGSGGEGERGTLGWKERGSPALLIPLPLESFTSSSLCWLPPPNAVFMPSCLFPTLSSSFSFLSYF